MINDIDEIPNTKAKTHCKAEYEEIPVNHDENRKKNGG